MFFEEAITSKETMLSWNLRMYSAGKDSVLSTFGLLGSGFSYIY